MWGKESSEQVGEVVSETKDVYVRVVSLIIGWVSEFRFGWAFVATRPSRCWQYELHGLTRLCPGTASDREARNLG